MDSAVNYHQNTPFDQSDNNRPVDLLATDDDRTWATLIHLGGFASMAMAGLSIIVPLILWLIKRKESSFIDDHGKEAINFQISLIIWNLVAGVMVFACGIGIVMAIGLYVMSIVTMILNAIRANHGEYVRYPIPIRFLT